MTKPSKRDIAHGERSDVDYSDEEIIKVTRQFPIVLRRPLIYGMLIILIGLIPWSIAYGNAYSWVGYTVWWMIFCMAFLGVYWLSVWVGWFYSVYVLTDKRIVITTQKGFFNRTVSELALNNIQNVTYGMRGMQAAIFHFGSINVQTLSGSGGFDLTYIHKPERFSRAIIKASGVSSHGSTEKSH